MECQRRAIKRQSCLGASQLRVSLASEGANPLDSLLRLFKKKKKDKAPASISGLEIGVTVLNLSRHEISKGPLKVKPLPTFSLRANDRATIPSRQQRFSLLLKIPMGSNSGSWTTRGDTDRLVT